MSPLAGGLAVVILPAAAVALLTRRRTVGVGALLVLGFLLALAYALLGAPDVALAEAAIGSGVTGVLFVHAVASARSAASDAGADDGAGPRAAAWRPTATGVVGVLAALGLTVALGSALAPIAGGPAAGGSSGAVTTGEAVEARLGETGVEHPVTAVLLDFRAVDTFLEIVVLLVSVVLVLNLAAPVSRPGAAVGRAPARAAGPPLSSAVTWFVRIVGPLLVLVAAWLLFAGSSSPGGAFQSGAVIAALLVLLALGGYRTLDLGGPTVRWVAVAAVVCFAAVALGTLLASGVWLQLPATGSGVVVIALETVLAVVIGASLAVAFLGLREVRDDER